LNRKVEKQPEEEWEKEKPEVKITKTIKKKEKIVRPFTESFRHLCRSEIANA